MSIFNWLVLSSKNADKVSLTIKGLFASLAIFSGLLQIPLETWTELEAQTVALVGNTALLVSSVVGFYGAVRKVWLTYRGENAVLKDRLSE